MTTAVADDRLAALEAKLDAVSHQLDFVAAALREQELRRGHVGRAAPRPGPDHRRGHGAGQPGARRGARLHRARRPAAPGEAPAARPALPGGPARPGGEPLGAGRRPLPAGPGHAHWPPWPASTTSSSGATSPSPAGMLGLADQVVASLSEEDWQALAQGARRRASPAPIKEMAPGLVARPAGGPRRGPRPAAPDVAPAPPRRPARPGPCPRPCSRLSGAPAARPRDPRHS